MAQKKKEKRTVGKFLEYLLVRVILLPVLLIPFRLRGRLLERLNLALGRASRSARDRIYNNIRHAFPEMDGPRVRKIAWRHLRNLGRMLNEFYQEPRMDSADIERWIIREPDAATHERMLASGGILVLGHLGSWEWKGVSITNTVENDLYVFAKRQSNPWMNALIERIRRSQRIKLIYTDESPRLTLSLLKQKALVAFIADQDAGKQGEFFPFFGRLASTFQGPAVFARMTDVPVYYAYSWHDEAARLHFHLEPFERPAWNAKDDPRDWEREFTYRWVKRLEETVEQYPGDYYWIHRRWHTRPEDPEAVWKFWREWEAKRGLPHARRNTEFE